MLASRSHDGRNVQVIELMTGGSGRGKAATARTVAILSNHAKNPVETVEAELGIEIERYAIRAGWVGPVNGVATLDWS